MSESLTDVWRSVALSVPKALAFVAVLLIGYIVARVLRSVTNKVLERVRFDHAVERGGVRTALARSRYDASDLVSRLVFYAVLLFTLQLGFGLWGPNPVSDLIGAVVAWLPRAFVAVVIVVVAAAIAAAVKDVIANALSGLSYGRLLASVASVFILGFGVIAALNQIGVATAITTPVLIAVLATVSGILIVGVGGGLVRPMERRWEGWLDRAAEESRTIAERARAHSVGRRDAEQALAATSAAAAAPVVDPAEQTQPVSYPHQGGSPLVGARTGQQPSFVAGAAPVYGAQPSPIDQDRSATHEAPAAHDAPAGREAQAATQTQAATTPVAAETQATSGHPATRDLPATQTFPAVSDDATQVLPRPRGQSQP